MLNTRENDAIKQSGDTKYEMCKAAGKVIGHTVLQQTFFRWKKYALKQQ